MRTVGAVACISITDMNAARRCLATTCAVCSRTCAAALPLASNSPAPQPSPTKASRLALSHFSSNTNHDPSSLRPEPNAPIKRKKAFSDDETFQLEPEDDLVIDSGCNRVVCRGCCIDGESG